MMTVDGDVSFVLKFDCSHVADCHSNAMQENEEESQIVEDDFEADEFEDEPSEMGSMPFHLEVEIRRSNLHDKFLNLELEVSPDLEEKQKYSLFLSDISVDNVDGESSYRGPQIDSLDEEIRDTIEEFAKKNLAKVIPLIVDYSVATDDANYINWLQNAKEIVS